MTLSIIYYSDTRGEYHYGHYDGTVDHYAYRCYASHTDLSQCSYYYHSSCNANYDQLGLICYSPIIGITLLMFITSAYGICIQVMSVLMVKFDW